MGKLAVIEGIGEVYEHKLADAGVLDLPGLLAAGADTRCRQDLAQKTGISDVLILEWVNRADMMRISGIGEEYSDLLEAAGVDTVPELAQRVAENLHEKLIAVNKEKNLVNRVPSLEQVEDWVKQARALPRMVSY